MEKTNVAAPTQIKIGKEITSETLGKIRRIIAKTDRREGLISYKRGPTLHIYAITF